jgi:hypothetical protein
MADLTSYAGAEFAVATAAAGQLDERGRWSLRCRHEIEC